jgi:transposase
VLFPHLAGLRVERVFTRGRSVRLAVISEAGKATCPDCGVFSARVHSRYERRLADMAVGGQDLMIHLRVRRFMCDSSACSRKTFAERFPELVVPYARRTLLLRRTLETMALALGGRPAARLARGLCVEVSRSTLLRLLRALPLPAVGSLAAVGVDDFAFRRGHTYGTVLVDMHTRQPVELLADRLSETFADWLRTHPGAQVICRDRAGSYAEGARVGAPDAIQVADRWHLFRNLSDAVDRVARNHRGCLRELAEQPSAQPAPATASTLTGAFVAESVETTERIGVSGRRALATRQRHAEVHALLERGMSLNAISRELQLQRNTVRRYARAATAEEMLTQNPKRGSQLDPFTGYLAMRWEQDCTNAVELTAEIRRRGYRGSERSVRDLVSTWRTSPAPPSPTPLRPPTSRQVTMLMMRPRHKLTTDEDEQLHDVLGRCETLRTVNELVSDFAGMARGRHGHHLNTWIATAQASGVPQLRGFATGLLADYDAVRAGLTLPWSSGAVEGNVTRIKAIKRQMYGRANFDLLRRRVLLAH